MKEERPSHRVQQVSDAVRREVSRILLFNVRNPKLHHVTVTQVRMTADLKEAHIYYDCEGSEEDRSQIEGALDHASGFLRHELAKVMAFKFVPRLYFHFDETRRLHKRATELLDKVHHVANRNDK